LDVSKACLIDARIPFEFEPREEYDRAIRETPMRLLVLALALSVGSSAYAAPSPPARQTPVINPNAGAVETCPPTSRYEAARRGGKLPPSLLTELPGADMYNAVYRKISGCDVGGTSGNAR
jgi:hypothetical protein